MKNLEDSVAINNVKCIQFRPRISSDQYYITIRNNIGCSSHVNSSFLYSIIFDSFSIIRLDIMLIPIESIQSHYKALVVYI